VAWRATSMAFQVIPATLADSAWLKLLSKREKAWGRRRIASPTRSPGAPHRAGTGSSNVTVSGEMSACFASRSRRLPNSVPSIVDKRRFGCRSSSSAQRAHGATCLGPGERPPRALFAPDFGTSWPPPHCTSQGQHTRWTCPRSSPAAGRLAGERVTRPMPTRTAYVW
jgi:hypothetical protein